MSSPFSSSHACPHLNLLCGCRCHLGLSVVYDTVSNLSWAVDIRTHGIVNVIEKVLSQPWPPSVDVGREVPEAKPEEDCVVRVLVLMNRFARCDIDVLMPSQSAGVL